MKAVRQSVRADVKWFDHGLKSQDEIELEFKKYKKDFDLGKFRGDTKADEYKIRRGVQ